jgi:hypothetical protein
MKRLTLISWGIATALIVAPAAASAQFQPNAEVDPCGDRCQCYENFGIVWCACWPAGEGWPLAGCHVPPENMSICLGQPCDWAMQRLQPQLEWLAANADQPKTRKTLEAVVANNAEQVVWSGDRSAIQLLYCDGRPMTTISIAPQQRG